MPRACFEVKTLKFGDVGGLWAFLALAGVETDLLAFVQGPEAGALDRGVVDEQMGPPPSGVMNP